MIKKISAPANAFGAGKELIGKTFKGHTVTDASRKYMHLDNGETVERKGNRVNYEADVPEHRTIQKQRYDFNGYPID